LSFCESKTYTEERKKKKKKKKDEGTNAKESKLTEREREREKERTGRQMTDTIHARIHTHTRALLGYTHGRTSTHLSSFRTGIAMKR
jgi:hypothetical protein